MTVCAVVRISDNIVENIIVAEPTDLAPDGCFLVKLLYANFGDVWDGESFAPPTPAPESQGGAG